MKRLLTIVFAYIHCKPWDVLIIVMFVIAILALLRQYSNTPVDDDWEHFVAEHHCTANKFKNDKSLKSGWICDDGKEYYRWRQQL